MVTDLDPPPPTPYPSPPQMEGMVTDLTLAREKQQAFEEWMRSMDKKLKLDLQVTVRKGEGGADVAGAGAGVGAVGGGVGRVVGAISWRRGRRHLVEFRRFTGLRRMSWHRIPFLHINRMRAQRSGVWYSALGCVLSARISAGIWKTRRLCTSGVTHTISQKIIINGSTRI